MPLTLTKDQIEKLQKLDVEMEERLAKEKIDQTKREQTSSSTGIPVDIAGLDVIKIGTLFGLIKKKDVFEGNEKNSKSLLKILFGNNEKIPTCPLGYYKSLITIKESEKIEYHQYFVQKECSFFVEMVELFITEELKEIGKLININLPLYTLEHFKTTCLETLDVLIDELTENYNDDELWTCISTVRNALLGTLNVCEYKKLVTDNIVSIIYRIPKHCYMKLVNHLTIIDKRLSLFNKALTETNTQFLTQTEEKEKQRLIRELTVRCYTKPPELVPFVYKDITQHICIPSLMYLPIETVINTCLVGPYRNNSIGFLIDHTKNDQFGDFYILTTINPDGGRLWSVDPSLERFTNETSIILTAYIVDIFRTLYKECFGNNLFYDTKTPKLVKNCNHHTIFHMLLRNLALISDGTAFYKLLVLVLKSKSPLFPTEYDFFNFIKSVYDKRSPYVPVFELPDVIFETNLKLIFDDFDVTNIKVQLLEFLNS